MRGREREIMDRKERTRKRPLKERGKFEEDEKEEERDPQKRKKKKKD